MEFLEINACEFSEFAHKQKNENFWQSTEMACLRKWNGWSCCYVGIKDEGEIIAATMLSYRRILFQYTYVQALRGFYIDYHDHDKMDIFHQGLLSYLKKLNCLYFKVDPYFPLIERDQDGEIIEQGYDHHDVIHYFEKLGYVYEGYHIGNDLTKEPNWMFVKNIEPMTKEALLQSFDHQTRWSIRKTMKIGIKIKEGSILDLPAFKDIMEHTAKRRSFEDRSMNYYEGLFQTFGKEKIKIVFAQLDAQEYYQNLSNEKQIAQKELADIQTMLDSHKNSKKYNKKRKVVEEQIALLDKQLAEANLLLEKDIIINLAAAIFILVGKEIVYLYSGAYKEYMKFNGPYAIQWYMLCYAMDHHFERYNFYGISGNFQKDAEDYGVYEFKKGFNGEVVELLGDFHYIVKPNLHNVYKALRAIKHRLSK